MTIARWPLRGSVVSRSHCNSAIAFSCENGAGSASTIRLLGFDANRKPDITIQLGAHPTMSGELDRTAKLYTPTIFNVQAWHYLRKIEAKQNYIIHIGKKGWTHVRVQLSMQWSSSRPQMSRHPSSQEIIFSPGLNVTLQPRAYNDFVSNWWFTNVSPQQQFRQWLHSHCGDVRYECGGLNHCRLWHDDTEKFQSCRDGWGSWAVLVGLFDSERIRTSKVFLIEWRIG